MKEIIKLGLILLIITSVAALALGYTNMITADKIIEAEAAVSEEARKEVLDAETFNVVDGFDDNDIIIDVYEGVKGNNIVGYAITTATPGYGGNISVITGISKDGEITGIKVVRHNETPGLGANATSSEWQAQFKGKSTSKEVVVVKSAPSNDNEIQALTGATISSVAVSNGVNEARKLFNEKLNK